MAKRHNPDDDDFMNNRMNERLEELEARITDIYTQASKEAQDTLNSYLERYSNQYNEMRQRRADNEITREEFNSWIQANMLQRDRYTATVNQLTDMLVKTDKAAMAVLNGELPYVIAESYNFVQFVGNVVAENTDSTIGSFQIYNARSVQAIIRDNPDLLPRVNTREDTAWNRDHITREITQGILQGDSIPHVADRLQRVTNMDRSAAIRNARTAMTGAENLGRNESYQFMTEQGIEMVKLWSATYDGRTRESHLRLDGTKADKNGLFGVGIIDTPIQYPGDPAGDPEEIYNCRCRLDIVPPEYSRQVTAANYDKWMQENFPDDYAALSEREDEEHFVKPEVAEIEVDPATEEVIPVMAEQAPAVAPVREFSIDEQVELMENYVSGEGYDMNRIARGEDFKLQTPEFTREEVEQMTRDFTALMDQQSLPEAVNVYRGATADSLMASTGLTREQILADPEALVGQTITERGFVSTTADRHMAEEYSQGDVFWDIQLPEGARAIHQNDLLPYLDGDEYTVQRDSQFVIDHVHIRHFDYDGNEYENGGYIQVRGHYVGSDLHDENGNPISDSAQTQTPIADIIETAVENTREDVAPEPEVEHPTVDHQIRGVSKNEDARTSWIEDNLGVDREEASAIYESVARYTAGDAYSAIHNNQPEMAEDIQNIDAMLNNPNMPIFDGVTYRGVHIDDSDGLSAMDKVNAIISGGTWNEPGITSFTDDRRRASLFASAVGDIDKTQGVNVLIINRENLTGCPVQHLSACNRPEHEILIPSDIQDRGFEIISSKVQHKVDIIEAYENEFHPELNHPERRLESTWVIIEVRENGR